MTTASPKETVEEPQEPEGDLFSKIEDIVEDLFDDKPEEFKPVEDPDEPEPDPCCGPPNIG